MWRKKVVQMSTFNVPFSIFDKSDDNKAFVATFATIEASKENMVGHRCSKRRKKN